MSAHGDGSTYAADWGDPSDIESATTVQCNSSPMFSAPTYSFTISENATSTAKVGEVSATDPGEEDTVTYSILSGNVGGVFVLGANATSTPVLLVSSLDYETTPQYTLTIEASDGNGGNATATVEITVMDVVENGVPPPVKSLNARSTPTSVSLYWKPPGDSTAISYPILRRREDELRVELGGTQMVAEYASRIGVEAGTTGPPV